MSIEAQNGSARMCFVIMGAKLSIDVNRIVSCIPHSGRTKSFLASEQYQTTASPFSPLRAPIRSAGISRLFQRHLLANGQFCTDSI